MAPYYLQVCSGQGTGLGAAESDGALPSLKRLSGPCWEEGRALNIGIPGQKQERVSRSSEKGALLQMPSATRRAKAPLRAQGGRTGSPLGCSWGEGN